MAAARSSSRSRPVCALSADERGGARPAAIDGRALDPLFAAAVEATEEAVLNSMLAAPTVTGRDGNISEGLPAERVVGLLRACRQALGRWCTVGSDELRVRLRVSRPPDRAREQVGL